jgi:hypothetical protein
MGARRGKRERPRSSVDTTRFLTCPRSLVSRGRRIQDTYFRALSALRNLRQFGKPSGLSLGGATRPELSSSSGTCVFREVLIEHLEEPSKEGWVSRPSWTANKILMRDGLVHVYLGVSAAS